MLVLIVSIGYPVVTLGFGVKSYVGYKFRLRKQREVAKENKFYDRLLAEALPSEYNEDAPRHAGSLLFDSSRSWTSPLPSLSPCRDGERGRGRLAAAAALKRGRREREGGERGVGGGRGAEAARQRGLRLVVRGRLAPPLGLAARGRRGRRGGRGGRGGGRRAHPGLLLPSQPPRPAQGQAKK